MPFRDYATTIRIETDMAAAAAARPGWIRATQYQGSMPVAADRNPWIASPGYKPKDFAKFTPDRGFADANGINLWRGTGEEGWYGNSPVHKGDCQNVLYSDGHVDIHVRCHVGIEQDNIYTRRDGTDKVRGLPPDMTSQPADKDDCLLVNDPPAKP